MLYFIKKNYNELKKFIYRNSYLVPLSDKAFEYFIEYDKWVRKLHLKNNLYVFDIGCDNYISLFHYLIMRGFTNIHYIGYDVKVYVNVIHEEHNISFTDYFINEKISLEDFLYAPETNKFLKVDCEGCEYDYMPLIYNTLSYRIAYAIALHKSEDRMGDFLYWSNILLDNGFKMVYKIGSSDFMEYLYIRRRRI